MISAKVALAMMKKTNVMRTAKMTCKNGSCECDSKLHGPVRRKIAEVGDLVFTGFNEAHALRALEPSEIMVFTRGPRGGRNYETDTYRLEEKLVT
jgi:hypothetical protein